jgi:hypothetical protein
MKYFCSRAVVIGDPRESGRLGKYLKIIYKRS